ncbi:MAG: 4-(cytidine 5'-diphospho)-2-C-methyl-D-erythritol kinase [Sphingomonadales bacterium]|nr:4-(cytidine 5'-diphospho)-2-C-methyl-D-erythritol kinase [Sphingomonadales bacterium]
MTPMTNSIFPLTEEKNGWLCALAPAKVNLFLHVTGRRDDGFHELESVFAFTKFGDEVRVRKAGALSLEITGPFAASLSDDAADNNLVIKAAKALQKHAGCAKGAEIVLEKSMPIAAGIGGGSSDAAATLRALIRLWDVKITDAALHQLALGLGADVPACINPHTSFVSGIGENVRPVRLAQNFGCVLVNSGQALSTPQVFAEYKNLSQGFSAPLPDVSGKVDIDYLLKCKNDLTAPACALYPNLNEIMQMLSGIGKVLLVRMSGSGATCLALTGTLGEAQRVATTLKKHHPQWWCKASEFIS